MNKDYENIKNLGYEIDIAYGRNRTSTLYLMKNGVRTKIQGVEFISNNRNKEYMFNRLPSVRQQTHLGKALSFLNKLLLLNMESQECGITIKR